MFDIFVFASFLLFFFMLSISVIKTKIKNNELLEKLLASNIDNALIKDRLESELNKKDKSALLEQEGFINFLNQSRDWAFNYIESVQYQIKDFESSVKPLIDKFESNAITDFQESTMQLIESSKNLITLLPEEEE